GDIGGDAGRGVPAIAEEIEGGGGGAKQGRGGGRGGGKGGIKKRKKGGGENSGGGGRGGFVAHVGGQGRGGAGGRGCDLRGGERSGDLMERVADGDGFAADDRHLPGDVRALVNTIGGDERIDEERPSGLEREQDIAHVAGSVAGRDALEGEGILRRSIEEHVL